MEKLGKLEVSPLEILGKLSFLPCKFLDRDK